MRIALTGASSTGKTTLLKDLLVTPIFKQYGIVSVQIDVLEIINAMGIRADGAGTNCQDLRKFQWLLLEKKIDLESCLSSSISDRSTVDMAAYWIVRDAKGSLDAEGEIYLAKCREFALMYDFHVHLPFGAIPFVNDGQRPSSEIFNKKTCNIMRSLLDQWGLPYVCLNKSGRKERVDEVLFYLKTKIHTLLKER